MDFTKLNPFVRSVGAYEVINRQEECTPYDSRLIYVSSGELSVFIQSEKKIKLSDGNLIYIPAGCTYRLKGQYFRAVIITFDLTDEYSEQSDMILPTVAADFDKSLCHYPVISPFDKVILSTEFENERETLERIVNIATSCEGKWRDILSAEVKLLLIKLYEMTSEDALPARMVESLDTYIRENCSEEISNTEIGAIFGYHPFYVSRVLKEKKGITLRQYIIAYRLKAAKKLLSETKASVSEIAEELGFTDASYFTKTFRQSFGMTPKEYRNSFKDDFV